MEITTRQLPDARYRDGTAITEAVDETGALVAVLSKEAVPHRPHVKPWALVRIGARTLRYADEAAGLAGLHRAFGVTR